MDKWNTIQHVESGNDLCVHRTKDAGGLVREGGARTNQRAAFFLQCTFGPNPFCAPASQTSRTSQGTSKGLLVRVALRSKPEQTNCTRHGRLKGFLEQPKRYGRSNSRYTAVPAPLGRSRRGTLLYTRHHYSDLAFGCLHADESPRAQPTMVSVC